MPDSVYQVPLARTANEPITEGIHPFTIVGFSEGEGNAGPYWKFDCRCDTPTEENKMAKPLFLSLSPQSRWKLELFLDAVGAPPQGNATADKFINRRFRGKIVHDEYQGRKQAQIEEMFPLNAAPVPPTKGNGGQPIVVKVTAVKAGGKKVEAKQPQQPEAPSELQDPDVPAGF